MDLLASGAIEVLGLLPYSSNYVFLTKVSDVHDEILAVYKPQRGERPLWDFPSGSLAAREVAAYAVSAAGGWDLVPETIYRGDAPHGPGSLQVFVEHDPERHFFVLMEDPGLRDTFASFAAYDVVINPADRMGGHVLADEEGRLWGVDHGLSFHIEPKLRTVIWGLAGDPLPETAKAKLTQTVDAFRSGGLAERLSSLLSPEEVIETQARAEALLLDGVYPAPTGPRPVPWPLV